MVPRHELRALAGATEMSILLRSIEQFSLFCRKADVVGTPRLSISFDSERDAAYFEREVQRELRGTLPTWVPPTGEFTIYGVHVRIVR
jgi:hypothetical protein